MTSNDSVLNIELVVPALTVPPLSMQRNTLVSSKTIKEQRVLVGNVAVAGTEIHTHRSRLLRLLLSLFRLWRPCVQALKRVDRIGQKRSVIYYDLVASRSVDDMVIMPNLLGKQDVAVRTVAQLKAAIGA